MQIFDGKKEQFIRDIDNIHMVWLEEIQQEANHMFSRDFNAEPELMPKTPSQKKNGRRKRVSVGRQEEGQARRRLSKGRRSNLSGSSVKSLNFIAEDAISGTSVAESSTQLKHTSLLQEDVNQLPQKSCDSIEEYDKKPELVEDESVDTNSDVKPDKTSHTSDSPVKIPSPNVESISASAEQAIKPCDGRTATKIAIAGKTRRSRRTSVRCSLKVRHSLAGLRHSMTQDSLHRASQRSMMKRKAARMAEASFESVEEADEEVVSGPVTADPEVAEADSPKHYTQPSGGHITSSMDASDSKVAPPSLSTRERSTQDKKIVITGKQQAFQGSIKDIKSEASDHVEHSPIQSAFKPHMRSFLHTVQKNQLLMMSPSTFSRNTVIKSFFKHTTPLKADLQAKERQKLEALKKKQDQEEERLRKIVEEKKKKQEESKRKKEERLRKVIEAKVKEEQKEEEKKKKIELKMAQIDEKNDKRQAEEKAKKRIAIKRQDELEQKQLAEETRRKKIKQAEEDQLKAKELAEARRLLEMKREQERERELERERQAAAERERELERAAREKERRELEEKRKAEEEKLKEEEQQRLAAEEKAAKEREASMQIEAAVSQQAANAQKSLQATAIIPVGGNTTVTSKNPEDYGMDLNSDDSTDDESTPRKPIPSWAEGHNLQQIIMKQYFNPPDLDSFFGIIEPPELENIFYKSKPRYFKRTSSAVWQSPPVGPK
ncbi:inner centromere protein A-like isoform X2 [Dunckerocampus dactyliophorus]|nr:inner centromere protein A-like isoform X2 [Dunckerocampus dactyliophorus]